jgi:hypothetical protein
MRVAVGDIHDAFPVVLAALLIASQAALPV